MNLVNMDLKQRYTKDEFFYELENSFIDTLEDLPIALSCIIIFQLDQMITKSNGFILDSNENVTRGYFCNVIKRKDPKFYVAHYIVLKNKPPLFFHLEFVDSDTYLDYLNHTKEKNEITHNPVSC